MHLSAVVSFVITFGAAMSQETRHDDRNADVRHARDFNPDTRHTSLDNEEAHVLYARDPTYFTERTAFQEGETLGRYRHSFKKHFSQDDFAELEHKSGHRSFFGEGRMTNGQHPARKHSHAKHCENCKTYCGQDNYCYHSDGSMHNCS